MRRRNRPLLPALRLLHELHTRFEVDVDGAPKRLLETLEPAPCRSEAARRAHDDSDPPPVLDTYADDAAELPQVAGLEALVVETGIVAEVRIRANLRTWRSPSSTTTAACSPPSKLAVDVVADYARLVEMLMAHGPVMGMPHARAMGQGLFELRPRARSGIGRAFYCFVRGRRIVIIHAYRKKTRTTPGRDLAIARQRAKEIQGG